jgi:putative hydrolase of the HAD superfamily
MSGEEIRALLLDIGQVILRINIPRAARRLADGAGKTPEQVIAAIEADPKMVSFQEGGLRPEEWHEHLKGRLGLGLGFEEFCAAWNSALEAEPILDAEFFSGLRPGLRLGLISNTDPIHVKHVESEFAVIASVPVRLYSCSVGKRKPHREIYERAIAALRAPTQAILYVDDVEEFVEAGKQAGMQVHHFRGAEGLLREMQGRKLLR